MAVLSLIAPPKKACNDYCSDEPGLSGDTHSIRSYGTFGEVGGIISRTAFTQLGHSPWILTGALIGLAFTYLLPVALTIAGQPLGAFAWLMMSSFEILRCTDLRFPIFLSIRI